MNVTDEAKAKFMAVCSEWADLLIRESVNQKTSGGLRWQFTPEQLVPPEIELPESQRQVWLAAHQLLLDAWDVAPPPENP